MTESSAQTMEDVVPAVSHVGIDCSPPQLPNSAAFTSPNAPRNCLDQTTATANNGNIHRESMNRLSFLNELGYNDYYHRHQAVGQRDFERRTPERSVSSDSARSLPRRFAGGLEAMQSSVFRTAMEYMDDDSTHEPQRCRIRRSSSSPYALRMARMTLTDEDHQQHDSDTTAMTSSDAAPRYRRHQKRPRRVTADVN